MNENKLRPGYIAIPKEHLESLLHHKELTGVAEWALLKANKKVSSSIVSGWLQGNIKTARPEKIEYVLKKWSSLPDKKETFVEVTNDKRREIREAIGSRNRRIAFGARNDLP